ncbi:hypothetical protein FI667_g3740, partial [Globisporangium splendens]
MDDDDDSDQEFARQRSAVMQMLLSSYGMLTLHRGSCFPYARSRFLEEDDDESSASFQAPSTRGKAATSRKPSSNASVATSVSKKLSPGSAITAAAAALLATSKLQKPSKAAKKTKQKKKSATIDLSDSEEPPPSYSSRRGSRNDPDNDDSDERRQSKKKKAAKKNNKPKKEPVKKEAKATISLEDRVAQILKRTGSSAFAPPPKTIDKDDGKKSDNDDDDAKSDGSDESEKAAARYPTSSKASAATAEEKHQKSSEEGSDYDAKRLCLSDSFGMESADFEVGLQAKRKLEHSRLSMSSLNSEKFAVNIDALEGSELATNPRYATENDPTGKGYEDNEGDQNDDYADEDFELDQTTVGDLETGRASTVGSESSFGNELGLLESSKSAVETPFVSQFEKMKELFSIDSSFDPVDIGIEKERDTEEGTTRHVEAEATTDNIGETDNFGYEDGGFEVDEGVPPPYENAQPEEKSDICIEHKSVNELDNYQDDDFEQSCGGTTDAPASPSPAAAEVNAQPAAADEVSFVKREDVSQDPDNSAKTFSDDVGPLAQHAPTVELQRTEAHQVASISPPPPPPPDYDEPFDEDLSSFTLDKPDTKHNEYVRSVPQPSQPDSAAHSESKVPAPQKTMDRFQQIQSQVSSLRFIEVPQKQRLSNNTKEVVPLTEPMQQPVPAGRLDSVLPPVDLDEEAKEIDDFLRQSMKLKQERQQMRSMRASVSRESELALRLQQAQHQILQLKRYIQETESENKFGESEPAANSPTGRNAESHDAQSAKIHRGGQSVEISKEEYDRLRKEIKDSLIQAYQKENEQLMQQLQKIQQGVKYDVHLQNEELRSQLKEAREQLEKHASTTDDGLPGTKANMGQYSLAVEARLKAEAHAIALQEELSAARATHQDKENELKVALDRLKKAKVELECRYEGIDLEKMAEESLQMKKLQRELDLKKKESEFALASLQKKLDWYVGNQHVLDAQDDEVRRLKYQVTQLESEAQRLRREIQLGKTPVVAQSPSKHQTRNYHRSAADIRRIQELENRLLDMEEAMRKRHPDSLVNLILASRKADDESKLQAMEDEYQRHMKAKEEEIEQIQEANEKKLKSFRQQQERLVLQFQKRIREQEKLLQKAGSHQHPKALQKRQVDDDREIKDELKRVRNFYTEKIKDVERKWEMKYRSLRKQQYGAVESSNRDLQNLSYADSTIVITNLQRQLREKEVEVKKLTKQIQESQESATSKDHLYPVESNDSMQANSENQLLQRKNEELRDYIRNLESQLWASEEARSHLIQTLSTLQTFSASGSGSGERQARVDDTVATLETEDRLRARVEQEMTTKFDSEVESMKKAHQDELTQARQKISTLEGQAREHLDAWGSVQIQLSEHVKEVHRLQQLLSKAEQEKRTLEELADKIPFLEGEVIRLQKQLSIPRTPSMLQHRSLEMKIETLTQKHLLREAELKVLLTKATQSSDLEKLQLERIHQNAIAAKNAEIRHFKKQVRTPKVCLPHSFVMLTHAVHVAFPHKLDEILDQLELLRESPGSMAP